MVDSAASVALDEVDTRLPLGRTMALGLQHVLVMYTGAVTVPLIVGGALKLPGSQIALLINADLLCCGLASLIQSLGFGRFVGIRLPLMMGVSYAGIGSIIAISLDPRLGLTGLYGAILAAGALCFLLAPWMSRVLFLFPPLVTGTALLALGVGLLEVAVAWIGGGFGAPDFGSPFNLCVAGTVMLVTLVIARFVKGFFANISILAGIAAGTAIATGFGRVSFSGVAAAPWLDVVRPFQFGAPTFDFFAVLTMSFVVIITMVESIGLYFSLGEVIDRRLGPADFARGLRADALGAAIGGIFNTFPYTSYAQNIGLVAITGVRSRYVCVAASAILMLLSLLPKAAQVVASIPNCVLGGAALIMFGTVAGSGVRMLQAVDFRGNRHNSLIFAVSLGTGLIPTLSPKLFDALPSILAPLLHSGVLLAILSAMILNFAFNGGRKRGA